ncbi:MAG: molybdopterin-binding/glycosyltransferase family 2 protein [Nisaea sp.]|uniref:molybdopterin-binding/glycosyltransferase family 2 protein n=1 Tax=Nisaea sp. TaxID=2024842 RepID=UPI001B29AF0B|nr:molybdopterin-binding/glycosyltransferase family 2 protein [Nisaea sp.]MBO6559136.1 molybdopterin-binding/glycosyltransferase family 2 protein [Nisaea sp.]
MYFGELPVAKAEGAILAHSRRLDGRSLKKGRVLDHEDLEALKAAGIDRVVCARLDDGDIPEDRAADRLAEACRGADVRAGAAFTGRSNLFAEREGVVLYDPVRLDGLNLVDESITLGLVPPFQAVSEGQMIGTLKIIPFAVPDSLVKVAEALASQGEPLVRVKPYSTLDTILIQSKLPGTKESVLDSTLRVTSERLEALGSRLITEARCEHSQNALADAIRRAVAAKPGLILISGASAVVDRRDVIPAAVEQVGGQILHFGMPVDPGNLMLIGRIGSIPVIGMPGCARSPKLNGFDWALQRICAGLEIRPEDIMRMGAGGLLKDVAHRPLPRASAKKTESAGKETSRAGITAIVLAAGQSTRMGAANKLLSLLDGKAMVRRVVETALASTAGRVLVVTGHEPDRIRAALAGLDVAYVHNPNFAGGISTSVRTGISALPEGTEAALVCLGDMPQVSAEVLNRMIAAYDPVEGRAIIVPLHDGRRGNPVLWDSRFFGEMQELEGDRGARMLLDEFADLVCEVEISEAGVHLDIDTPEMLRDAGGTLEEVK